MARTPEQIVAAEVLCNMSWLVATLANRPDDGPKLRTAAGNDLADLCWQAIELACPIDDWEGAATQEGWAETSDGSNGSQHVFTDSTDGQTWCAADWQALCNDYDIEPYQREVFEHWAVSDWFADKLIEHGEKVDKDFAGLCVWARTTSGQAIYADSVVERIAADLVKGA